jgi:integration host factor subunit beta
MTKADLIDLIAERAKLPHGRAELLICQMFDSMVDALCRGEGIEIRGFGSFSIREYKEYQGRNPRTGEAVQVRPKRLAFFKVGKELRERVNGGKSEDAAAGAAAASPAAAPVVPPRTNTAGG